MIALIAVGYVLLVIALFWGMERVEQTTQRAEDRRAESAGIAVVCAFVMVAMVLCAALGIQPVWA